MLVDDIIPPAPNNLTADADLVQSLLNPIPRRRQEGPRASPEDPTMGHGGNSQRSGHGRRERDSGNARPPVTAGPGGIARRERADRACIYQVFRSWWNGSQMRSGMSKNEQS